MHRLLVDTASLGLDSPTLPKEAADHLKVLRPRDGETIELFDGHGSWRVYEVEKAGGDRGGGAGGGGQWNLKPVSPTLNAAPPTSQLTLFACVTKGSRWDWTIEKATELGVTRIVPVISERTIVRIPAEDRPAKRERWQRIAEDAARQSDAKWLPEIVEPVDFAAALELVKRTRCLVGALTDPPPRMILDELLHPSSASSATDLSLFVGPEGDFTPSELASLLAIATPVSFGPTILRAETAAIFGVSVLSAHLSSTH